MLQIEKALDKYLKINVKDSADRDMLEKQYEKVIELINKSNDSRASLNSFHQTVSAAVVGIISGIYNFDLPAQNKYFVVAAVSALGLALCYIWGGELRRYYRSAQIMDLIAARIEAHLPVNPLDTRIKILSSLNAPARTEKQEQFIPLALSMVYSAVILVMVYLAVV
jgi:hypothetical protein